MVGLLVALCTQIRDNAHAPDWTSGDALKHVAQTVERIRQLSAIASGLMEAVDMVTMPGTADKIRDKCTEISGSVAYEDTVLRDSVRAACTALTPKPKVIVQKTTMPPPPSQGARVQIRRNGANAAGYHAPDTKKNAQHLDQRVNAFLQSQHLTDQD